MKLKRAANGICTITADPTEYKCLTTCIELAAGILTANHNRAGSADACMAALAANLATQLITFLQ